MTEFEDIVADAVIERAREQGWEGLSQLARAYVETVSRASAHSPTTDLGRSTCGLAFRWANEQHTAAAIWESAWDTGDSSLALAHDAVAAAAADDYFDAMKRAAELDPHDIAIAAQWVAAAELDLLHCKFIALAVAGRMR